LDTKAAYSCPQRKAVTSDLDVPTFTKNVKVGQPPAFAKVREKPRIATQVALIPLP
jgi:hypothetical protein